MEDIVLQFSTQHQMSMSRITTNHKSKILKDFYISLEEGNVWKLYVEIHVPDFIN